MFRKNGWEITVWPSGMQERIPEELSPEQTVMYLSLGKALDVERQCAETLSEAERCFIVGADTVVFLDRILGKPKDEDEAFQMLKNLRNRQHRVLTGVTILEAGTTNLRCFYEVTCVQTTDYSEEDIWNYIRTGEPMDKAGAYAIQGRFAPYIASYTGDYENVIGFPWRRAAEELKQMGVDEQLLRTAQPDGTAEKESGSL